MSRILMLTCQFMPEVYGGAEQQCLKQALELNARGHRITIVTSRRHMGVAKYENLNGIRIRRFITCYGPDLLGRYLLWSLVWLAQLAFYALRHRGQYDVVHCHQGKFGIFAGAVMAKIMGVPMLVKIGNSGNYMDLKSLKRKKIVGPLFLNWALKQKPVFVAISTVIAQDLREFGIPDERIVQIVNGVIPHAAVHAPEGAMRDFFWHGRFEEIKNLELMLKAFAVACKAHDGIRLHLIGKGRQQAQLKTLAKDLKIAKKVTFHPPSKTILADIAKYDVFLNTSHAEGMSNSMLEAMACGKVIVSTRVSGTDEIVDENLNGFVVPQYEAEAIAEAILKAAALTEDELTSVFDYSMAKTTNTFAMGVVVDQYEALYKRMLG